MNRFTKTYVAVLIAALFILAPLAPVANATAPLVATNASTAVTYSSSESITLSTDTATLALSTTQQTIHVTVAWALATGRVAVQSAASFNVAAGAALTGTGSDSILSSNVLGQGVSAEESCDTPVASFPGSYFLASGFGPICDMVNNVAITGANMTGTNTAPFKIRISPTAVVTPDQNYTGTLFFYAAAM
jgi:hypothetical protein